MLLGGDLLLIEGQDSDLDVLRGLQELEIETKVPASAAPYESERLTLMDATQKKFWIMCSNIKPRAH